MQANSFYHFIDANQELKPGKGQEGVPHCWALE